jgi:hypothetical protein
MKKIDLNLHREKQELLFTFMHDYPHKWEDGNAWKVDDVPLR